MSYTKSRLENEQPYREAKISVNVPHGRSNRCANFQLKGLINNSDVSEILYRPSIEDVKN